MSNKNTVKRKDDNKEVNKEVNKKVKEPRRDKLRELAEDEDASIFKRVAVLLGVMFIAFALILVGIKVFFELKYRFDKKDINVLSKSKEYGLMLEAIDTLDSYTEFNTDMKNDLTKNAKYAVKNYDYYLMDSEKLAGLLLADKCLELDRYDKLVEEMKKYYDEDAKLINSTKINKNTEIDKDAMVANTISVAYMLRRYDDVFAEIDIYTGLANFFNEKIESSDAEKYSEYLREIFFFMYEENKQGMIKTDKLDDILKQSMEDYKTKIDREEMLYTINDVMMAKRLSEYRQFFYNDSEYIDSAQDVYEEISNEGGFMTDTYNESYMYALDNAIFSVTDLESNEYFLEHVADTFTEYYDNYLEY